jgi:hypothetical protein
VLLAILQVSDFILWSSWGKRTRRVGIFAEIQHRRLLVCSDTETVVIQCAYHDPLEWTLDISATICPIHNSQGMGLDWLVPKLTIIRHDRKMCLVNQGREGVQDLLFRVACCWGGGAPAYGQHAYANESVHF